MPTTTKRGTGLFGSMPSIRASRDPLTPGRDLYNTLAGKPKQSNAPTETAINNAIKPDIPDPPAPPLPPQSAQAPNTTPLKRRNAGGIAVPAGSTLLSGPSGIATSQLSLGSQTLLGGG